jgi:uncharacterized RDD family membrane protein YckC
MNTSEIEYVGFWVRVGASLIDTLIVAAIIYPVLTAVYGTAYWSSDKFIQGPLDLLFSYVLPAVAIIVFWISKQATPGKMVFGARVVDAATGGKLTATQSILRYLGYYVSVIPLCLGLIWVAFDPRKQGWHDKIAGTVVVRARSGGTLPVKFDAA